MSSIPYPYHFCNEKDIDLCIDETFCVWCEKELNYGKCISIDPCNKQLIITLYNKCPYGYTYDEDTMKCPKTYRESFLSFFISILTICGFLCLCAMIVLAINYIKDNISNRFPLYGGNLYETIQ